MTLWKRGRSTGWTLWCVVNGAASRCTRRTGVRPRSGRRSASPSSRGGLPIHAAGVARTVRSMSAIRSRRTPRSAARRYHRAWSPTGSKTRGRSSSSSARRRSATSHGANRGVSERESRCSPRTEDSEWRAVCAQAGSTPRKALVPLPRRLPGTEEYKTARRRALTDDEQKRLFEAARSRPEWIFAYVASALAFYCGLRACEIRGLQWKHVDWDNARIQIRRSEDAGGLARPKSQRRLRASAQGVPFACEDRRLRKRGALPFPVARTRQED